MGETQRLDAFGRSFIPLKSITRTKHRLTIKRKICNKFVWQHLTCDLNFVKWSTLAESVFGFLAFAGEDSPSAFLFLPLVEGVLLEAPPAGGVLFLSPPSSSLESEERSTSETMESSPPSPPPDFSFLLFFFFCSLSPSSPLVFFLGVG